VARSQQRALKAKIWNSASSTAARCTRSCSPVSERSAAGWTRGMGNRFRSTRRIGADGAPNSIWRESFPEAAADQRHQPVLRRHFAGRGFERKHLADVARFQRPPSASRLNGLIMYRFFRLIEAGAPPVGPFFSGGGAHYWVLHEPEWQQVQPTSYSRILYPSRQTLRLRPSNREE
jgi:hypothetical protein